MKLFQKFWLYITGITSFVLLVVMLVYTYSLYNAQVEGMVASLDQQAATSGTLIDSGRSIDDIAHNLSNYCLTQEVYAVLMDRAIPENSWNSAHFPTLQQQLERQQAVYANAVATATGLTQRVVAKSEGQALLVYGRPMPDGRYLLMLTRIATLPEVLALQVRTMLNLFLAALVLVTLISGLLAGSILRPIQEIDRASQQIAQGNLDVYIRPRGRDELASLSTSINSMSRQLQKSDSFKNEIISNVSHNLKTPIAAILTYAELLDGQELSKERQQEFVGIIAARAHTLEEMVASLILLSKIQAGNEHVHLSAIDLPKLCKSCMEGFSGLTERRHLSMELRQQGIIEPVVSDSAKLETVLVNLLSNAVNHSYCGGRVWVELARVGDATRVSVCDEGEGIHPDDLPLIWDRFYKSPHSRINRDSGSGIGMHIVKSMFELLGLAHGIESTPGEGTTVWLEIGRADAL